jgi:periplasmic protein TonB
MAQQSRLGAIGGSFLIHAAFILFLVYHTSQRPGLAVARNDQAPILVDLLPASAENPSQPLAGSRAPSLALGHEPPGPAARSRKAPANVSIGGSQAGIAADSGGAGVVSASSAVPSTVTSTPASSASSDQLDSFRALLLAHIQRFREYPESAREARTQGVVVLHFAMDRQGNVLDAWIERGSGAVALDAAALSTIRRAQPLPHIPAALPDQLGVTLPLSFGLT